MSKTKIVIHLDLDGATTACGLDLYESYRESSLDLKECTCKNCKEKYRRWRKKFDEEYRKEILKSIRAASR